MLEDQGILSISDSPIHGHGVFAADFIPAGTNLGAAQIKRTGTGYDVTDLGRYHNHSDNPSCYNEMLGSTRYLITSIDLFPGDEVTIDYRLQPDLEQPKHNWK